VPINLQVVPAAADHPRYTSCLSDDPLRGQRCLPGRQPYGLPAGGKDDGSGQTEYAPDGHGGQLGLGQEPGDGGLRDQVRVIGLGV
jgi:hypothetical protein